MPGISVMPEPSTTSAPAGTFTLAVAPTSAMRPSRITTVWPGTAGVPLPSITVTPVMAISAPSLETYCFTFWSSVGRCAWAAVRHQDEWQGRERNWSVHGVPTSKCIIIPACRCSAM